MSVLAIDKKHVLHPYSLTTPNGSFLEVVSASGVHLTLGTGEVVVDAMSSWWAAIHGYQNPTLDAAIKHQIDNFSHVMFGGLTHKPAATLAQQLVDMTAAPLTKVFFSDSGSVSVEVSLKMALQYWMSLGQPQKKHILTVRGGYHGDTLGTMALCDPDNGMHAAFNLPKTNVIFCDKPTPVYGEEWAAQHLDNVKHTLATQGDDIAAIILEPVVQNACGLYFYHPHYLSELRQLCDQYDVLLILDEIATGFGRTGTMFGYEHANIYPDIMCVGKALTGGYMSLAATLCTDKVAEGIAANGLPFMHGPTFMGNPLACSAASASIALLQRYDLPVMMQSMSEQFTQGLAPCQALESVKEVRIIGGIGVVELHALHDMPRLQALAIANGVWIRPLNNIIYLIPPYIATKDDIATICAGVYQALLAL